MAYQTVDAVRAMERAGTEPLAELRADGGATVNKWLMQFQADVLGVPVVVPAVPETTSFGAAMLAGVGASLLTLDGVAEMDTEQARYEPRMGEDERESLLGGWHRALERRADLLREAQETLGWRAEAAERRTTASAASCAGRSSGWPCATSSASPHRPRPAPS